MKIIRASVYFINYISLSIFTTYFTAVKIISDNPFVLNENKLNKYCRVHSSILKQCPLMFMILSSRRALFISVCPPFPPSLPYTSCQPFHSPSPMPLPASLPTLPPLSPLPSLPPASCWEDSSISGTPQYPRRVVLRAAASLQLPVSGMATCG